MINPKDTAGVYSFRRNRKNIYTLSIIYRTNVVE